jgi:integrase
MGQSLSDFSQQVYFTKPRLRAPGSRESVEIQVRHFARYWAEQGYEAPPAIEDLTRDSIQAAMAWQVGRGRKPQTANKLGRTLLGLANYASERMDLPRPKRLEWYPELRSEPDCWSVEQVESLIRTAGKLRGQLAGATRAEFATALLWLAYNSGERIDAVMSVQWAWIDWTSRTVRIPAAARKDREEYTVWLMDETVSALLVLRRAGTPGVFDCWNRDRHIKQWPALNLLLRKIVYSALIDPAADVNTLSRRDVSAVIGRRELWHKIRRSFATEIARNSDESTASRLLGHSSIATTRRYIDRRKLPLRPQRDLLRRPAGPQLRLFADA